MKRYIVVLISASFLLLSGTAFSAVTLYNTLTDWQSALSTSYSTEDFQDESIDSFVSVTSTGGGGIGTNPLVAGSKVWWDNAKDGEWYTIWTFDSPIYAFGAVIDTSPLGPGTGLEVHYFVPDPSIPIFGGLEYVISPEISHNYFGLWWGFVSDTPFTKVAIQGGTQSGEWEQYFLDNLSWAVYVPPPPPPPPPPTGVPEPSTLLLLGSGLVGLAGFRRKFKI